MTDTIYRADQDTPRTDLSFDDIENELHRVEDTIAMLSASDDVFVEDLVLYHAYKKALIAALSSMSRKRRRKNRRQRLVA